MSLRHADVKLQNLKISDRAELLVDTSNGYILTYFNIFHFFEPIFFIV